MKKRFIKLMFIFTLLFGISFTLVSCNKNDSNDDGQQVIDDDKPETPVTPVTPDPVTPVTPDPVTPVTPDPVTPVTPDPINPNILDDLPEDFYDKLLTTKDKVDISLKDFTVTFKEAEYTVEEAFVRIAIIDSTLYGCGSLQITNGEENLIAKFSLDDKELCAKLLSPSTFDEEVLFENKETEEDYSFPTFKPDNGPKYFYKEMKIDKEFVLSNINELINQYVNPDFDINEVDDINDLTALIPFELPEGFDASKIVASIKSKAADVLEMVMGFLFEYEFDENTITATFTLDNLKTVLSLANKINIKNIINYDGVYDKIVALTSKYLEVNTTEIDAPAEGETYYTYNTETKEYVEVEGELTAWEENTKYYVDNKDLGEYTLGDLLLTSEEDKVGFVDVNDIESVANVIFEVLPYITKVMNNDSESETDLSKLQEDLIVRLFAGLLVRDYYDKFVQTSVTEFDENKDYYVFDGFTRIYNLSEWIPDTEYYTYDTETERYVLVDQTVVTTPEQNTKYFVKASLFEAQEDLKAFDPNFTYFTKVEDQYVIVGEDVKAPVEGTTYYCFNFDVLNRVIKTVATTPIAGVKYYTFNDETKEYVEVEGELTAWAENTNYYTYDEETEEYTNVALKKYAAPVEGEMYYTEIGTFAELLKAKAIQNMHLNDIAQMASMFIAQSSDPVDLAAMINPYVGLLDNTPYGLIADLINMFKPNYVEVEGELTAWTENTDYYTFDLEAERYILVDQTVVESPDAETNYFTLNKYTADDISKKVSEYIKIAEDSFSLSFVTDNEANIKNINLTLEVDSKYVKVNGSITIDFTKEYEDNVKEDIIDEVKANAGKYLLGSTKLLEELLTDDVFDNLKQYSLVKEEGKIIGIKEVNEDEDEIIYYLGTAEELEVDPEYEIESNVYPLAGNYYVVYAYTKISGDDYDSLYLYYDISTKKFVTKAEATKSKYYIWDYEQDKFVDEYVEVDKENTTPDQETDYYVITDGEYELAEFDWTPTWIEGKDYYLHENDQYVKINTTTTTVDEEAVYYILIDGEYESADFNYKAEWEADVTYYTRFESIFDCDHNIIEKVVSVYDEKNYL